MSALHTPASWRRGGSSSWHHDRCGRRLKAFIYLNNVSANAHPTQLARGSHNTFFYTYDSLPASRLGGNGYVERSYGAELASMTGRVLEGSSYCYITVTSRLCHGYVTVILLLRCCYIADTLLYKSVTHLLHICYTSVTHLLHNRSRLRRLCVRLQHSTSRHHARIRGATTVTNP